MSEKKMPRLAFRLAGAMTLHVLLIATSSAGEIAEKLKDQESENQAVSFAFREAPVAAPASASQPEAPSPTPYIDGEGPSCMSCCCRPNCGFFVYSEATFLVPFTDNEASVLVSDVLVPSDTVFSDPTDELSDGLLVGPRIWLGYQCDHFGVAARYWGVADGDGIEAQAIDLEGTFRFCFCGWNLVSGVGGRYAKVQTGGDSAVVRAYPDIEVDPLVSALALSQSEFEGAGTTFGLWGNRPVCCNSSWNYFWSARGSYIWGGSLSALAYTNAIVVDPTPGSSTQTNTAYASDDNADLFIGEIQVGLQWQQCLKCCPAQAFFRVAFEAQTWSIVSGDVLVESFSRASVGPTVGIAYARAGNPDLDLMGFTIGAGLTY